MSKPGSIPRAKAIPFHSHRAPDCVICSRPLTVAENAVGTVCFRNECKDDYVREQALAELRRKEGLRERAKSAEQALIHSKAIPADADRVRGVLPSNRRRLTGLPKRHRRPFSDRLMETISKAAAIQLGKVPYDNEGVERLAQEDASGTQLAILNNGCAVCRGHCCFQGHGHAFIHVDTVLGFMKQHPDLRPREVLEAYLSRIPHVTYEDSCVYHSEQGCTLPREMRSVVCNSYLCKGLDDLIHQFEDGSSSDAFVVSVSDYYKNESDDQSCPSTHAAIISPEAITPLPLSDEVKETEPSRGNVPSPELRRDATITSSEA